MSLATEIFAAAAKALAAEKAEVLSALGPVNVFAEGETLKLTDEAAAAIEARDPLAKVVIDAGIAKLQAYEASELPVLEGDGVDQLVAVLNKAAA